jgi:hypothetical protein
MTTPIASSRHPTTGRTGWSFAAFAQGQAIVALSRGGQPSLTYEQSSDPRCHGRGRRLSSMWRPADAELLVGRRALGKLGLAVLGAEAVEVELEVAAA